MTIVYTDMKFPKVKLHEPKEKVIIPRCKPDHGKMSTKTRSFLQRIIHRRKPAVDMTRHGFVSDRLLHPVVLMMRPLKIQLGRILSKPDKIIIPNRGHSTITYAKKIREMKIQSDASKSVGSGSKKVKKVSK